MEKVLVLNKMERNQDCLQMASWYVLKSMGFDSFGPGEQVYSIGRPVFDKVKVHLSNGKIFEVIAKNNSPENRYVQSAVLNGEQLEDSLFTYDDIAEGGKLEFEMGDTPQKR